MPKSPNTPGSSGGSDFPLGGKIAIGAVLLAVAVALIVAAVNDGGTSDDGIDAKSRVAFQPVSITGDSLPTFPQDADSPVPTNDPAIGMALPAISGKTFDGSMVKIETGKPQLIAVVAHWCPHCQAEVPLLVEWMKSGVIPESVEVVAISTAAAEAKGNYPPASWLEKEDWKEPVLVDDPQSKAMNAVGATGFPTLIAVDKDGNVARRGSGELTQDQVETLVDAALGKDATAATPTP